MKGVRFFRLDYNVGHTPLAFIQLKTAGEWPLAYCGRLYGVYDRIRKRFPDLILKIKGGGGRTDIE